MNSKNKRRSNKSIEIELNISSTVIKIIIICILIGMITGTKVITTVIQAEKWRTLETAEENLSAVTWVDSIEIDGEGNVKQVPIPKGYTASQIEGETTVSGGFVIYEGDIEWNKIIIEEEIQTEDTTTELTLEEQTEANIFELQTTVNQWVWVPVEDISEIYGVDAKGNIWGKLYEFSSSGKSGKNWTESNGVMSIINKNSNREPDIAQILTRYEMDSNLQLYAEGKTRYELLEDAQKDYYAMLKSIKEYGGFYIGRYETGGLKEKAVVQKMNTDIGSQSWYVMYEKCKNLKGTNKNVRTSMISGALWDATLEWIVDSEATNSEGIQLTYSLVGSNSVSWGNYLEAAFEYIPEGGDGTTKITKEVSTATRIPTGSADYTKVNNIYDMVGNVKEWTLEEESNKQRVMRGGDYNGQNGNQRRSRPTIFV